MNVPSLHQQPDRIEQAFPGRGGRLTTTMNLLSSSRHQQPDRIDDQNHGRQRQRQEPSSPRAPNSSPSGSFRTSFPAQTFAGGQGGGDDGGHYRHQQQRWSPSFTGMASVVPVVSSDGREEPTREGGERDDDGGRQHHQQRMSPLSLTNS